MGNGCLRTARVAPEDAFREITWRLESEHREGVSVVRLAEYDARYALEADAMNDRLQLRRELHCLAKHVDRARGFLLGALVRRRLRAVYCQRQSFQRTEFLIAASQLAQQFLERREDVVCEENVRRISYLLREAPPKPLFQHVDYNPMNCVRAASLLARAGRGLVSRLEVSQLRTQFLKRERYNRNIVALSIAASVCVVITALSYGQVEEESDDGPPSSVEASPIPKYTPGHDTMTLDIIGGVPEDENELHSSLLPPTLVRAPRPSARFVHVKGSQRKRHTDIIVLT